MNAASQQWLYLQIFDREVLQNKSKSLREMLAYHPLEVPSVWQ
jgi:hypothetical protein